MENSLTFPKNEPLNEGKKFSVPLALVHHSGLKPHEMVDPFHLRKLLEEIKRDGFLFFPVMVDRSSLVVLDGHHRVSALISLGCQMIPAYLVDYNDDSIQVSSWRENFEVSKDEVILRGLSGKPFPPKTSKHTWPWSIPRCPFPLSILKMNSPMNGVGVREKRILDSF